MNKKLIAAAVASVIAGPAVMSVATADVSIYGAIYPRMNIQDSKMTLSDGGSRFGFKSTTDMGNGNTVSAGSKSALMRPQVLSAQGLRAV